LPHTEAWDERRGATRAREVEVKETPLRIIIADDDRHARAGIRAVLTAMLACEIVGEAMDGEEAIAQVECHQPDAVLMDLRMPVLDGLQATRMIKGQWPEIMVVALTMYSEKRSAAMAAGADAFVSKGETPTQIIHILRAAAVREGPKARPAAPGCCRDK
jgi:DNA-binding NarL/FixJ family response regulator